MKLPPVHDPGKYAGLYVYDFGDRVSIGYTANEVRMLREVPEHRGGTAYEIYRVNERGGFELRGSSADRLGATEAMCFLRGSGAKARGDYDELVAAAERVPIGANVEAVLGRVYDFDPPDVTALLYAVSSSAVVSAWLRAHLPDFTGAVEAGCDVHARFTQSSGMRIASSQLAAPMDYTDRPYDVVMAQVGLAVQR